MNSPQEMSEESRKLKLKVDRSIETAKEKFRILFRGMTKGQMLDEFRIWPDESLVDFCERVMLDSEDYEICDAIYL